LTLAPQAFWFLRHGETDWNARNLSQGNVDIPLNPVGIAQAQTAASLLRHRGIRTIVSSPLSRAHDTALAAAAVVGAPVLLEPGLREVAFGEQEGQPMGDWYGAEPFAGLRERAVAAINRALQREPIVLVVAHGGLFRAIRSAMGLPPNIRTPNGVPLFCEPGTNGAPWTLTPAGG